MKIACELPRILPGSGISDHRRNADCVQPARDVVTFFIDGQMLISAAGQITMPVPLALSFAGKYTVWWAARHC
jgi:hypothetical protein